MIDSEVAVKRPHAEDLEYTEPFRKRAKVMETSTESENESVVETEEDSVVETEEESEDESSGDESDDVYDSEADAELNRDAFANMFRLILQKDLVPEKRGAFMLAYKAFLLTLYLMEKSPLHYNVWLDVEDNVNRKKKPIGRAINLAVKAYKDELIDVLEEDTNEDTDESEDDQEDMEESGDEEEDEEEGEETEYLSETDKRYLLFKESERLKKLRGN
jgi:hypothetical protein